MARIKKMVLEVEEEELPKLLKKIEKLGIKHKVKLIREGEEKE